MILEEQSKNGRLQLQQQLILQISFLRVEDQADVEDMVILLHKHL